MEKLNYKDSGVDIAEGNALVENLKGLVKQTFNPNVLGGIGSFSGAFLLPNGYMSLFSWRQLMVWALS